MVSYENQLIYLLQEEVKISNRINRIRKDYTNAEWQLESFEFYTNKTSCDYSNCSHGSLSNGIKNVCRVVNKKTGERLNLGTNCYLKLFRGVSELDNIQKREAQTLTNTLKKETSQLSEIHQKKEIFLADVYELLETTERQLKELGIPMQEDFSRYLKITNNKEIKHIVKILDNALAKYQVELEKLEEMTKKEEKKEASTQSFDNGSVADFWKTFNRKKRNSY